MVLPRETLRTGADPACSACGKPLVLGVYRSAAGYYVGTWCCLGPETRESGYYETEAEARRALDSRSYTR